MQPGQEAFAIVLQQAASCRDLQVSCAVARTSNSLRQAVQQCRWSSLEVELQVQHKEQLHSFVCWLPKHAALVKSINICFEKLLHSNVRPRAWMETQLLLEQALHRAAWPFTATPGPGGQRGLTSFSSTYWGNPNMLHSLPAHSLTSLDLQLELQPSRSEIGEPLTWELDLFFSRAQETDFLFGAALSVALAQLSCLQQLSLAGRMFYGSCLEGIAQLSNLQSLSLDSATCDASFFDQLQLLLAHPLPLQHLHLHLHLQAVNRLSAVDAAAAAADKPTLDMSALSQLQELSFTHRDNKLVLKLPERLQQLRLAPPLDPSSMAAWLPQMQHVQQLSINVSHPWPRVTPQLLLQLAQLPALQWLALEFEQLYDAAATAAAWRQLPQLCELRVGTRYEQPAAVRSSDTSARVMAEILAAVAASSGLTKLDLVVPAVNSQASRDPRSVAACPSLAGLTGLKTLCICPGSCLAPGDALALTTLTGLTRLELAGVGGGVGDAAAAALAGRLRSLCHLDLQGCGVGSLNCVAAIGQLAQLTELRLEGNAGLTQHLPQGLMLLTALTRLQQLGVDVNPRLTVQALKAFWAAVGRG